MSDDYYDYDKRKYILILYVIGWNNVCSLIVIKSYICKLTKK